MSPPMPRMTFAAAYAAAFDCWPYRTTTTLRSSDVSLDGQRYIQVRLGVPQPPFTQMQVVHSWFTALERLVPRE